ncbi:unnamed protein product [Adineta ricciae]|uniref:Uncharacterized protein n=1 Tax=Adineta ricciae TaxID=249248 RepID=A0A815T5P6_ADIRI|nr:unnamed protein product [Adineta ricciae]
MVQEANTPPVHNNDNNTTIVTSSATSTVCGIKKKLCLVLIPLTVLIITIIIIVTAIFLKKYAANKESSLTTMIEPKPTLLNITYVAQETLSTIKSASFLSAADVNCDNKTDIILTYYDEDRIRIFLNIGNGQFNPSPIIYKNGFVPDIITIADVNDDKQPDMIVTNPKDYSISVFLSTDYCMFAQRKTYSTVKEPRYPTVVDINNDHKPDIIIEFEVPWKFGIFLNKGSGSFTPVMEYFKTFEPFQNVAFDINSDAKIDIIHYSSGYNQVFLNKDETRFISLKQNFYSPRWHGNAVADVNGDGKLDIIAPSIHMANYGKFSIVLNTGNNSFTSNTTYSPELYKFHDFYHITAAVDINNDDKLDIITLDYYKNNVIIFFNEGNSILTKQITYSTSNYPKQVVVTDLNNDGIPDILIMSSLKKYLSNLNFFEPSPESNAGEDEHQRRTNIISTRVYLLTLILLLLLYAVVLYYIPLTTTITIQYPTKEQFEELPSDVNCPCSHISISHGEFTSIEAHFHQVCASDFVSDRWINATFLGSNATYFHIRDFRSFASAQFQGLASLCRLSKSSFQQSISSFNQKTLISPKVLTEIALRPLIQSSIDQLKLSISSALVLQLQTIRELTASNRLMSGLMTDTRLEYVVGNNRPTYIAPAMVYGNCPCSAIKDCTQSRPIGIYNIFSPYARRVWGFFSEQEQLIMKVPGIETGCYPLNSILESSLECFYDQTCVNNVSSYFPTKETFTAMTISQTSRFSDKSSVQSIVDYLMIENWYTNITYEKYYNKCIPMTCTYSTVKSNHVSVIVTKCIGMLSTLTMVLKLLIPTIIRWIRRPRNVEPTPEIPLKIKFQQLKGTLHKTLNELNIFERSLNDNYQIRYQRYATRLYIILIFISVFIFTTNNFFNIVMHHSTVLNPTESQYLTLQRNYLSSLSCPCSSISMSYSTFLKIEPQYHHICFSDIVSSKWIHRFHGKSSIPGSLSPMDYHENANVQFQYLANFCHRIRHLIDDATLDFLNDQFVSSTILSPNIFEAQIKLLFEDWKSTIKNQILRTIDIIRATTHGNQLISPWLNTNFSFSYANREIKLVPMKYSNCSCALSPLCRTDMGLYDTHVQGYYYTIRTLIPKMFIGCYPNEALLASTLECFYNISCTLPLYPSIYDLGIRFDLPLLKTNASISSPDETIRSIIDQLMIKEWSTNISFTAYYQKCAPHSCTFQYFDRNSAIVVITTIMSITGGLTLGLKIFLMISLLIIEKFKSILSPITLIRSIKNQFNCRNEQQIIDRLHFIFVIITLSSIYLSTTFIPQTRLDEFQNSSLPTYQELQTRFSDTLQCPCSDVSIENELFFNITVRFHQICSSDFVSDPWIEYLYNNGTIFDQFIATDFRASAFAQFQLLSSLCKLSQQIVKDSLLQLRKRTFVNSKLLSPKQLDEIIQSTLNHFNLTVPGILLNALALIRETTEVNKIITAISTNWHILPRSGAIIGQQIVHPVPLIYQGCNCGLSSKCTQPSGGMLAGCYPLEALLQSTFQCLYDQDCIDSSRTFKALSISSLESSRFNINMTMESIVNQSFIEEYTSNRSYEKYFAECAISSCRYSYIDKANIDDGITLLISLYGGLMIISQCMATIVVRLCRVRERRIIPDIYQNS